MSLIMIALFIVIFLIVLPIIAGIKRVKSQRRLALIMFAIPIISIGLTYNFIANLFYITSPDALELQVTQIEQKIFIEGKWIEKYERYSYGKDYISISLPEGMDIVNSDTPKFEMKSDENNYHYKEMIEVLKQDSDYNPDLQLTLFELELEKNFEVYFEINQDVSESDLIIQYIHVYYPPMDFFQYWVKTAKEESRL